MVKIPFCHFRKLENFKIFIGYDIKSYNESSYCSNLVQYLKFGKKYIQKLNDWDLSLSV